MKYLQHYLAVLKKYIAFSGRAGREEFWSFAIVNMIVSAIIGQIDAAMGLGILGLIYMLAVLLPVLSVTVRRLHDTNRSGWMMLVALIPILGGLVLLYFMIQDGQSGDNDHGADPKAA